MDAAQRARVAQQVAAARHARGWSQESLATASGVSPNTVGSIEGGNSARPGSLGKIMAALNIEPSVEVAYREGLSPDVHLVTEVVAMWLAAIDEEDRPAAVFDLMRHIAAPPVNPLIG